MDGKEYLDRDGLKQYDALLKRRIVERVNKAIAEYEAGDTIIIHEWVPPVNNDNSGQ